MKIAYLLLVHKNPQQLLNLILSIYDEEDIFVIHLDARCDIAAFQELFVAYKHVFFLEERYESKWGSYGLIDATLSGLRFIRNIEGIDRIIMLSGQDYPIKDPFYIKKWLKKYPSHIFMECFSVPWKQWEDGGIGRFPDYFHVTEVMDLYAGSQWASFPFYVIQIIFDFLDLNPLFITYFKTVFIPDECFFQTLLMNSGIEDVVKNIIGKNLHLISWGKEGIHPNVLNEEDMLLIMQSEKLFARKFEIGYSSSVLNYINQNIDAEKQSIQCQRSSRLKKNDMDVICILINKYDESNLNSYHKLKRKVASLVEKRVFFNCDYNIKMWDALHIPSVFNSEILEGMGYKCNSDYFLRGCGHYALLKYFRENPDHDYYWYIEDYVNCLDGWEKCFAFFVRNGNKADFVTIQISKHAEEPDWSWWDTLKFRSTKQPNALKVKLVSPVFRISNRALRFIERELILGWEGHFEVLLPTLIKTAGFSIEEFGNTSSYTP